MSVIADPAAPAQDIQASMPACACSGLAPAIWSAADTGLRYSNRNFDTTASSPRLF
jgi:hypothetical protein